MQEQSIRIDSIRRPDTDQQDCGRGHACQFCPQQTSCSLDKAQHEATLLRNRLASIGQIVLVMANKGGVGKSTVTANLAAALAARGHRVGVADADIHGPNQSRFFGFVGERVRLAKAGLGVCAYESPRLKHAIRVASLAFLMQTDDTPIVWRDAYKHDFIHHLIGSFAWGPLDFLIVDMPPGTGNELITLTDLLEGQSTAAVLVTTPQDVALMDSLKALTFCHERGLPLLGVVENMAGITCPHCDHEFHLFPRQGLVQHLDQAGLQPLAQIPLDPHIAMSSDQGDPDVLQRPHGHIAKVFESLVQACVHHAQKSFAETAAASLTHAIGHQLASADFDDQLENLPEAQRDAVLEALEALHGSAPGQAEHTKRKT